MNRTRKKRTAKWKEMLVIFIYMYEAQKDFNRSNEKKLVGRRSIVTITTIHMNHLGFFVQHKTKKL